MFYVYLLRHSVNKETYIGFTNDLKQRLKQHNSKLNKSTSRKSGEWKVIYTEVYRSEKDARERERRLKNHGSGKHERLKRLKNTLLDI